MRRVIKNLPLLLVSLALFACVRSVVAPPRSPLPAGKIGVVGEVVQEGLVAFHAGMTMLEAIRAAGGFTAAAQPNRASLTRYSSGMAASVPVRLSDVEAHPDLDMPLEEGDVISVPGAPSNDWRPETQELP